MNGVYGVKERIMNWQLETKLLVLLLFIISELWVVYCLWVALIYKNPEVILVYRQNLKRLLGLTELGPASFCVIFNKLLNLSEPQFSIL